MSDVRGIVMVAVFGCVLVGGGLLTQTDYGNDMYPLDGDLSDGETVFPAWQNMQHFDTLYDKVGADAYYNSTYDTCRDQSGLFLAKTFHAENSSVCSAEVQS